MRIGVLATQGAFNEHIIMLRKAGAETRYVRLPQELIGLDGLIIPGGESTTISKLMVDYNLTRGIKNLAQNGLPIFGTCAGMIVLASKITESKVEPLGLIRMTVGRNAFGRQINSFETELSIPILGEKPFPGIFIRAPMIEKADGGVTILARLANDTGIAARQGNILTCAFHPELTDDLRFHEYFLNMVAQN